MHQSAPKNSTSVNIDWDLYRALREQWTHEENLVNHRLMWLLLSQGLLFTAYGTLSTAKLHWLVIGFPFFGMVVAAVIGVSAYAAFEAMDQIALQYEAHGLNQFCRLTPGKEIGERGRLAAQALPFTFAALWMLAMVGAFNN